MNTRIAQQVGASFGVAIVAVVLQTLAVPWRCQRVPYRVLVGVRHHRRRLHPRPRAPYAARDGGQWLTLSTDPVQNTGRKSGRQAAPALEDAILDAAWEQLTAEGYGHFTIGTVAARARTSKPVLYRRWKTSDELLHAAIRHLGAVTAVPDPDTGTLRGDLLALLGRANTLRSDMAALLSSMLGSYFDQTALSPADLRSEFLSGRACHRTRHRARHQPG